MISGRPLGVGPARLFGRSHVRGGPRRPEELETADGDLDEMVLRARIRFRIDVDGTDPDEVEQAIATAIIEALQARHGRSVAVQVSATLDPSWAFEGPVVRER